MLLFFRVKHSNSILIVFEIRLKNNAKYSMDFEIICINMQIDTYSKVW